MNIIHVLAIAISLIGVTEHFVSGDTNSKDQHLKEQKVLLRKLQNFQQPKDETKPLAWNVLLADVLVDKIQIFSFGNAERGKQLNTEPQDNVLTKVISQLLLIYKKIFDKFIIRSHIHNNVPKMDEAETEKVAGVTVRSDRSNSPKDQIELIEPRYHGKQECGDCNGVEAVTEETEETKENSYPDCAVGLVRNENGTCVYSKLILAIPYHCPIGYRRDRLGYCRLVM